MAYTTNLPSFAHKPGSSPEPTRVGDDASLPTEAPRTAQRHVRWDRIGMAALAPIAAGALAYKIDDSLKAINLLVNCQSQRL